VIKLQRIIIFASREVIFEL